MKVIKSYKHYIIAFVILMAILLGVQPVNGLTEQGVKVLALIASILYLWLTVGTDWVSLLAIIGVIMTGAMKPAAVFQGSFGNTTPAIILCCVLLNASLADTGVIKWLATWFMTRKFTKGKPYLFIAVYLLGITLIGIFMNVTTECVTFIALTAGLCEEIGYKKGDPFYTAMIMGLFWMSNVTNGASPISHSLPLLFIGTAEKMGVTITYTEYLKAGIPFIIAMYILTIVCICLIWKPDAKKFIEYDIDAAIAKREPLSIQGKIASAIFLVVVVFWFIPDILPGVLPAGIISTLKGWGVTVPTVLGIALVCMIKVNDKPVANFRSMVKQVPVSLLIFVSAVVIFGSIFSSADSGISTALNTVLLPITSQMAPFALCAIAFLLCLILTNFVSNTVAITLFLGITIPVLMSVPGLNMKAIVVIVIIMGQYASLVPSAAVTAPLFFGDGHVTVKDALKWNLVMILFAWLSAILICYPIGNLWA